MKPFEFRSPVTEELPLIVSIPHTGTIVPSDIAASFHSDSIRSLPMTDWHLHLLYNFLPLLGVSTLYATYSRLVVDLNRPPDPTPLYPGRFETGLVATETFDGRQIFHSRPTEAQIHERRERYHAPYHRRLQELADALRWKFGEVYLIDAHSVASGPNQIHEELQEDVYLGDRDGTTCPAWFTEFVTDQFVAQGLSVARNQPYKGGYITDHYGRMKGVQALQIEMCQRVYMDEGAPGNALADPRFGEAREKLYEVFQALAAELRKRSARAG